MITTGTLTLTAEDGHRFEVFRALPGARPVAAVVVIQEVFGVNHHIQALATRFAEQGYAALAPALFDRVAPGIALGYAGEDLERGRALRMEIGWDGPVFDIAATLEAASTHGRVGVIGYCWGGSLAFLAATRLSPACAVCYYGGQIIDFKDETPTCPLMMHFGDADPIIPADARAAILAAQPGADIHVYPAGHGFNCTERPDFDPESARVAGERTARFLETHLT